MEPRRLVRSRIVAAAARQSRSALLLATSLLIFMLAIALRPQNATASMSPIVVAPFGALNRIGESALLDQQFAASMEIFQQGEVEKALRAWHALADKGHPRALYNLGVAHAQGVGVEPSIAQSMYWWHRAALAGSTEAQYNLGVAYAQGQHVEKSPVVASMYWYMAASGGDAAAQFNLGMMAAEGDGLRRDFENAVFWWQRAAAQGFPHAIQALDMLERQSIITRARSD